MDFFLRKRQIPSGQDKKIFTNFIEIANDYKSSFALCMFATARKSIESHPMNTKTCHMQYFTALAGSLKTAKKNNGA